MTIEKSLRHSDFQISLRKNVRFMTLAANRRREIKFEKSHPVYSSLTKDSLSFATNSTNEDLTCVFKTKF